MSRPLSLLWRYIGAVSIRIKVLGIVLGVIILLGAFIISQMRALLTENLIQMLEGQGVAIAKNIAEHIAATNDSTASITAVLEEHREHFSSTSHNTELSYVYLETTGGVIQARAGEGSPDDVPSIVYDHDDARIAHHNKLLDIQYPLDENRHLRVGLSLANTYQIVNQVSLRLFSTTLVMVAVGFAAAFFLTWVLTRPILDLLQATSAVARGDFSLRVPRWADDEIGDLATAFNDMMIALETAARARDAREQLQADYTQRVILAQENERQRIAHELHDSAGQALTSLLVGLQSLKQLSGDNTAINEKIEALRQIVASILDDIRAIAWQLRPAALDDLGLSSALARYLDDYQTRYGLKVEMVARGLEERLPPLLETAIYRIVQEGLTNIARHAAAKSVSVVITRKGDILKIIIEDDGRGFDPTLIEKQHSLGLRGIRERAALFHGRMTIESRIGQGTSIFVELSTQGLAYDTTDTHPPRR